MSRTHLQRCTECGSVYWSENEDPLSDDGSLPTGLCSWCRTLDLEQDYGSEPLYSDDDQDEKKTPA